MKKILYVPVFIFLSVLLFACSREPRIKNADIMTVTLKSDTHNLFYTGTIEPIKTMVLTSPAEGVVVDTYFQYGDSVKPGQPLITLSSTKYLSDYKTALLDYLKAKNDFMQNETQLKESDFLHKNLLISDDDYRSKKSTYYASQLSYMQSKDALSVYLKQLNIKDIDLYQLSISDIDKINKAIHLDENNNNLTLTAPANGLVLSPIKEEGESAKKISKGDVIKQGDTLIMIGDMSGIAVKFKVNELTINQFKPNQTVLISGVAFPGITLSGRVVRVDKQGDVSNSGLPSFLVEVEAPLAGAEKTLIYPGMSANVDVIMSEAPHMMIPIQALIESNEHIYVHILDQKTHALKQVAVLTGQTTPTAVEIQSGLHSGDRLVVPH